MTLDEAISILLTVHCRRDEPPIDYHIVMGATPSGWEVEHYATAWGVLWEHREKQRSP